MPKKPIGSTLLKRGNNNARKLSMIMDKGGLGDKQGDFDNVLPDDAGSVNPPYPYADTDSASCDELAAMISNVNNIMTYVKLTKEGYQAYIDWVDYANNRYKAHCLKKTILPDPIDVTNPVETGVITTPVLPPGVESGHPVDVTPPVTIDNPLLVKTILAPARTPYTFGDSGSGGGSGGGSDAAPMKKNKNFAWIAAILLMVGGAYVHSKS